MTTAFLPFGFLSPDSGDWSEALAESLDDFSLQQGLYICLLVDLFHVCMLVQINWFNVIFKYLYTPAVCDK